MPPRIPGLTFAPGSTTPIRERRPARSSTPSVDPARALGLTGESPFASAQRRERRETRRAVSKLPNPPRLFQAPIKSRYTAAERNVILREQGRRLHELARATGLHGDELRALLPKADQRQVDLFMRLAGQRHEKVRRDLGDVPRWPAVPAPPRGPGEKAWRLATVKAPMALVGHDFSQPFAQIGRVAEVSLLAPAARDTRDLVIGAVPALYETGAAGVALTRGDTGPAKKIIGALDDGALGHLARGEFREAAEYAREHPLFSALEFSGAGSAVGRTTGSVMRSGAVGAKAKRAASMERAPLVDAYGRVMSSQSYPADVIRKGFIVAHERRLQRRGIDPNRTTDSPHRPKGEQHQSAIKVDEFSDSRESLRRMGRDEARREMRGATPTRTAHRLGRVLDRALPTSSGRALEVVGAARLTDRFTRPERDVLHAVVEGRVDVKHFERDLRRERGRLERVYRQQRETMGASARLANREQVRAIDRVLRNPAALANTRGVEEAAAKYRRAADEITEEMVALGLLDPDQAIEARVRPYAVAKMGGRLNRVGQFVDRNGVRLTPERVLAHMAARDVPLPSFVSHRRDARGARAFFVNFLRGRKTVDRHRRTGRGTELGAHASDVKNLRDQHVHARGVVDAVRSFDAFAGEFGLRRRDGSMFTWAEATKLAEDPTSLAALDSHGNPVPGYQDLVPVRVVPARYPQEIRDAIAGRQDAHRLPDVGELVERRLFEAQRAPDGPDAGARNVVLIPADELARFRDHQQTSSGTLAKLGQVATAQFRATVLPFSTKWLFGNVTEAALRMAFNGVGVRSYMLGRRLVRELERADVEAAREFRARTLRGTFFGGMDRMAIRRDATSFQGTKLERPAAWAGFAARLPVIRQGVAGVRGFQEGVFAFNKFLEQQAQKAVIGKEARQVMQEMTGSWAQAVRASEPAFRDLVNGLRDSPNQVRFARKLDDVLGKYARFSPEMRKATQSWAPFMPWYLNSLRWVLYTLPAKHPAKTALLGSVAQAFQDDFEARRASVPPGDLEAGIRLDDGAILNLARFTPWGAYTNLPAGLVDPILPQISGPMGAFLGRSWTERDLSTADGETSRGDRVTIAINAFMESIVPGLSIARRVREGGGTALDDSTVLAPKTKPGTARSGALDRILNPLRPVYLGGSGSPAVLEGAPRSGRGPRRAASGPRAGAALPRSSSRLP